MHHGGHRGRHGHPVRARCARGAGGDRSNRCGRSRSFHVRQLRHSFACWWLEAGGSLTALQEILGHAWIVTDPAVRSARRGARPGRSREDSGTFGHTIGHSGLTKPLQVVYLRGRRGAGVVEQDGLENRCTCKGTVGSNPTLSASLVTLGGVPDAARRTFTSHAAQPALAPALRPCASLTKLITAAIFFDLLWPLWRRSNARGLDRAAGADAVVRPGWTGPSRCALPRGRSRDGSRRQVRVSRSVCPLPWAVVTVPPPVSPAHRYGEMFERLKEHDWKSCRR